MLEYLEGMIPLAVIYFEMHQTKQDQLVAG